MSVSTFLISLKAHVERIEALLPRSRRIDHHVSQAVFAGRLAGRRRIPFLVIRREIDQPHPVVTQLALHRLVLLAVAHFGIERDRQALAGDYIKTLGGGLTVVGLHENQPHQLVGLGAQGKQRERDLKMLAGPRQLLLRVRHKEWQSHRL